MTKLDAKYIKYLQRKTRKTSLILARVNPEHEKPGAEDPGLLIENCKRFTKLDVENNMLHIKMVKGWVTHPLARKTDNYVMLNVRGYSIALHRLVWILLYGDIPQSMVVDHKDRDKGNSRPENLRVVSMSQNAQNTPVRSDNRLGVKGVSYDPPTNRYRAEITVDKKTIRLGRFDTLEEAAAARKAAENKYHTHAATYPKV